MINFTPYAQYKFAEEELYILSSRPDLTEDEFEQSHDHLLDDLMRLRYRILGLSWPEEGKRSD